MKFHLPPGSRAKLEASPELAAAKPKQHHLVTTYFDTPDKFLERKGLTLRVRRSGETRIQNVKSQANGHSVATDRGEWEWPISQDEPDVSLLAETPALSKDAKAIQGMLEPVFVTDVQRTTWLLHLEDNTDVEAAIDQGSIGAGTAREPISELELELKGGCIGPVYRLAAKLQGRARLWIAPESKAARGWHLRTGQTEDAQLAQTPKLERRMPAAAAFHDILGGTLSHLITNIGTTLRGDTEGLHQMRRAIRDSRAVLQLFGQHLDAAATKRFNTNLRRFAEIFGAARDWDVFCLQTLPAATADLAAKKLQDLDSVAEVARQKAHAAVGNAVRGHDFTAMVLALANWAEAGITQASKLGDNQMGKPIGKLAPSLLDRAAARAKRRSRHAGRLSVVKRHELRKSLKKLCFDVESFAGQYRARAVKTYRKRCEALEKIVGSANDEHMARHFALSLVTPGRPDLAKPAGELARWSQQQGRKALQGFKPAVKNFRAAPAFWS